MLAENHPLSKEDSSKEDFNLKSESRNIKLKLFNRRKIIIEDNNNVVIRPYWIDISKGIL
tara:strand:- start:53 stop:232 length:180 start_codon:yes stop_codon:yes gene_type:complete